MMAAAAVPCMCGGSLTSGRLFATRYIFGQFKARRLNKVLTLVDVWFISHHKLNLSHSVCVITVHWHWSSVIDPSALSR